MKRLSILMAVYNREEFLQKAIESVLNQTYSNFDFIIIDDGSTDNSKKIVHNFQDERIQYYQTSHNGCWKAKNLAIKKAKTEFILFLDSDDFLDSSYLQNGIEFIDKFSNYDYYYPLKLQIVDKHENLQNQHWKYVDMNDFLPENLIQLFFNKLIGGIPHPGSFIRKAIFKHLGYYNDNLFNFSDTEYIIRNAFNINFKPIPSLEGYFNRQHSNQTNKNICKKNKSIAYILDFIIQNYEIKDIVGAKLEPAQFYHLCIEKFIQLANSNAECNEVFLHLAEKYVRLKRNFDF